MEGSLDGSSWTEIHRQKDSQNFGKGNIASFAVSNRECRFIRLTQTGKNRYYFSNDVLDLLAVEFFGEVLTE
jgi:hypothetical protein